MIQAFVDSYMKNKEQLREVFRKGHPDNYADVVRCVVEILGEDEEWDTPSSEHVTQVGGGDYSGSLLFIIGDGGSSTNHFWWVKISYGSCCGCDTLERIKSDDVFCDEEGYSDYSKVTEKQVDAYMTLALHIVQKLKKFDESETV